MVRSTEEIGAFAVDAQGHVVLASPVAEQVSGHDFPSLRNHHYLEYVPAEMVPEATAHFDRAMKGERLEGEIEIIAGDGGHLKIGYTAQPDIDPNGTIIGITGTVWLND